MTAGEITLGLSATKSVSLGQIALAFRRMPGAMWIAQADAMDHVFRGFWKTWKTKADIRRAGAAFSLTSPKFWPITITTTPTPSYEKPDFSKFRARIGTDSRPALLLETGGVVTPKNKRWIAIPVGPAKGKSGRTRPYWSRPDLAKSRGKTFVTIRDSKGRLTLHEVIKKKAGRGRPRKGAHPAQTETSPVPSYILTQRTTHKPRLHFHKTWREDYPNAVRRLSKDIGRAVAAVLAGQLPRAVAKARSFAA